MLPWCYGHEQLHLNRIVTKQGAVAWPLLYKEGERDYWPQLGTNRRRLWLGAVRSRPQASPLARCPHASTDVETMSISTFNSSKSGCWRLAKPGESRDARWRRVVFRSYPENALLLWTRAYDLDGALAVQSGGICKRSTQIIAIAECLTAHSAHSPCLTLPVNRNSSSANSHVEIGFFIGSIPIAMLLQSRQPHFQNRNLSQM